MNPLAILSSLNLILFSGVCYFFKRIIERIDQIESTINGKDGLNVKIAVLLDRDRNRRLQDYQDQES